MTEKEFKIKVLPLSKKVFPLAKRLLQNEEAAFDAVQLSMLKLWENRKKLDQCESINAFVFRVVRNTCLDEIKRKKPIYIDNNDSNIYGQQSIQDNFDEKEAVQLIKKILKTLPDNQRDVIQMRDIDGLEYEEITKILSFDLPYVRVLLSRARKKVRDELVKIYNYELVQKK